MKVLGVSVALCTFLTLSRAVPLGSNNNTDGLIRHSGLCEYQRLHGPHKPGGFVPQCDAYGNFFPQQCWVATGYCWCVDVLTGEEIPGTRTPPGTIPHNCEVEFYCPFGWSRLGTHCYVFIDSPKTWFEAEFYCLFEGANLAAIHSYEEDHFIQGLTRGSSHEFPQAWVGGHDAVYFGFWMWSDGSKFYYENWFNEVKVERKEHCLMINYGYNVKWNYYSCEDTLPFVCAKQI